MKPLGRKTTRTRIAGHQDCGVCHPETKSGRAVETLAWKHKAASYEEASAFVDKRWDSVFRRLAQL
jgi:hypothetical protein